MTIEQNANRNAESTAKVLSEWNSEYCKRLRFVRIQGITLLSAIVLLMLARIIAAIGHMCGWWGKLPDEWQVVLNVAQGGLSLWPLLLMGHASRSLHRSMANLIAVDEVEAIGPLCEALFDASTRSDTAVVEALCRLLPRVRAKDSGILTATQRRRLYSILSPRFVNDRQKTSLDVDDACKIRLQIATLKAVEQIGDSAALPPVQALADLEVTPEAAPMQAAVRDAALACLPLLRERAERERTGKELLRHSHSPGTDHLLKPASSTPEHAPQQLLRAGSLDQSE